MNSVLSKISNSRGITLLELIVALALTGMLLVFFIGANIFIQKVLINWSNDNTLTEEREFLLHVVCDEVFKCDSLAFDSTVKTLICYHAEDSTVILLKDADLLKDNKILNRRGVTVNNLEISQDVFTKTNVGSILKNGTRIMQKPVLYNIELTVSYKGKTDVAVQQIRNFLAYAKQ